MTFGGHWFSFVSVLVGFLILFFIVDIFFIGVEFSCGFVINASLHWFVFFGRTVLLFFLMIYWSLFDIFFHRC